MITVIGSINMDLVCETNNLPKHGETVLGRRFETVPGGKGANQAVAASRLGSSVTMIGAVGHDSFGSVLRQKLEDEKVDTSYIECVSTNTGIANIIVYNGDNQIIVVPGANFQVTPSMVNKHRELISQSAMVIMQLEIPPETVEYILELCMESEVPVILNPAPAENFQIEWMNKITYLTPNETEVTEIFGTSPEQAVRNYPNQLIVTLGESGAMYFDGQDIIKVEGYPVVPVDTTGAGDTFNGAFAHALTEAKSIKEAVRFANIAGSLSVEKFGAQGGMPTEAEVAARMKGGAL